jgi:hypothetical protein
MGEGREARSVPTRLPSSCEWWDIRTPFFSNAHAASPVANAMKLRRREKDEEGVRVLTSAAEFFLLAHLGRSSTFGLSATRTLCRPKTIGR